MNKTAQKFLEKAEEAQRASYLAITYKDFESAASIAYQGLFFTAQALLQAKEVKYRHSHSAVIKMFGMEYAKTQEMDAKFHRYLIDARKIAVIADHRIDKQVNEEQVREMLVWAKEFLKAGENYLK
ncbi:MAG: HEPN domain-containing protein [Chloroflexota bacterium]|nr:HEPN domain-containing protein [Chloroflexota bacterium]